MKDTLKGAGRQVTGRQDMAFQSLGSMAVFPSLDEARFQTIEVVKPPLCGAVVETPEGAYVLDTEKVVAVFEKTLGGLVGPELENAAAGLLLPPARASEAGDLDVFNGWVARRSQPLDPHLLRAFGEFYARRLNAALRGCNPSMPPGPAFFGARPTAPAVL